MSKAKVPAQKSGKATAAGPVTSPLWEIRPFADAKEGLEGGRDRDLFGAYIQRRAVAAATEGGGALGAHTVIQRSLASKDAEKLSRMFTHWVTKVKKSVFTPYFMSELEGALIAFYSFQDAYDYLISVVEDHAKFVGKFEDAVLGPLIGQGSEKDVYALRDYPGMVIGITKEPDVGVAGKRLYEEAAQLNSLLVEAGVPVAEIVGIIDYKGQPAVLMHSYAEGSKSTVANDKDNFNTPERVGNSRYLNEQSIADLLVIEKQFVRKKVRIDDIQFLIGSGGSVVVSDPLTLEIGQGAPTSNMQKMVNRLMEAAAQNVLIEWIQRERRAYTKEELTLKVESMGVNKFLAVNAVAGLPEYFGVKYDENAGTYRYNFLDEID